MMIKKIITGKSLLILFIGYYIMFYKL